MIKVLKISFGLFSSLVIAGCTTMSTSGASNTTSLSEIISDQQIELAKDMDELWDRARIIPKISTEAPMISTHTDGLTKISQQNLANLKITGELLEALDYRVQMRMFNNGRFDSIILNAEDTIKAPPLQVFKGQRKAWIVTSDNGEKLSFDVVWDEKGVLKIESTELITLQKSFDSISKEVEFPYFEGGVLPIDILRFKIGVSAPSHSS